MGDNKEYSNEELQGFENEVLIALQKIIEIQNRKLSYERQQNYDIKRNIQNYENKLLDKKRELQIECSNCSFKKSFCDELKEINGCTNGKLIKIIDELLEE